jgi:5-methylcytosine-specific restriction endonuclease McrA
LVPSGQTRCDEHNRAFKRELDRRRLPANQRGYDATWARVSRNFRAKYPVCGMRADGQLHAEHSLCVQRGLMTVTDLVTDHIVSIEDGGARLDERNLGVLCRRCNSAKAGRLSRRHR